MRRGSLAALFGLGLFLTGCGPVTQKIKSPAARAPATAADLNVIPVSVGDCGPDGYVNQPCVSVTVCTPNTDNCQTIPNVLLDTGSYGLRLFASVITIPLPTQSDSNGKSVAECVEFADGASNWGPVKIADIRLGGEPAVNAPMQLIDSTFPGRPAGCTNPDVSPKDVGFNGILGVGQLKYDCGSTCATVASNQTYFSCSGSTCTSVVMPLVKQVVNPVTLLPIDNNGVILQLPNIPSGGAASVTGSLILGVGTRSNNKPGNVTMLPADSQANFRTTFNGKSYASSFIDSGSNAFFFPASTAVASCSTSSGVAGWFCPPSITTLGAVMFGAVGSAQKTVTFQIQNAATILNSSNQAFNNLGGVMGGYFDWGLPFYFGRTVILGFENTTSSLGNGPYWAF